MKFSYMGKKYLFNSRSNFKGYRLDFLNKILAAANDSKIIEMVKKELDSRRA